jgi:TonB family protein
MALATLPSSWVYIWNGSQAWGEPMILKTVSRLLIFVLLMAMTFQVVPFHADAMGGASGGALQDEVSAQTARGTTGIEMLTPTQGVNFNSYLAKVYRTIKERWFAKMPASAAKGNKGIDVVEFRILQDGTVPEEFLKIRNASGKADLDEASLAGIRTAAPFAKLPADFAGPYIELRFTFYYNLEPPRR